MEVELYTSVHEKLVRDGTALFHPASNILPIIRHAVAGEPTQDVLGLLILFK